MLYLSSVHLYVASFFIAFPKNAFFLDGLPGAPCRANDIDNNNVHNNLFGLEGGLFEETNSVEEIAFKYAVDHINRSTLLFKSNYIRHILV